jgi:hypothetical protein
MLSHSRHMNRPCLASRFAPSVRRGCKGKRDADCTHGSGAMGRKLGGRTTGVTGNSGFPCAMVYGSFRALPGETGLACHRPGSLTQRHTALMGSAVPLLAAQKRTSPRGSELGKRRRGFVVPIAPVGRMNLNGAASRSLDPAFEGATAGKARECAIPSASITANSKSGSNGAVSIVIHIIMQN